MSLNRMMNIQIVLPSAFIDDHRRIVARYAREASQFSAIDWSVAIEAFDLLRQAVVVMPERSVPFPVIYTEQIEDRYGEDFIRALLEQHSTGREVVTLWADVAQRIPGCLQQAGFYDPQVPASRVLVMYCWYWWRAFAKGYMFEVRVFRDLERSGVSFEAHDLTTRTGRFAPYDLIVLGCRGDIKTSTYFLQATRSSDLPAAFYITRIRGKSGRVREMVVFMRDEMWRLIDGETLLTWLTNLADVLPQAARIQHTAGDLIVVDYDWWKGRVLLRQEQQEGEDVYEDVS